jgi:hypothetical protein
MQFARLKLVKKISAFLLLTLMLFINLVKVFHTHPVVEKSVAGREHAAVILSFGLSRLEALRDDHCPICDFKLAKDADATVFHLSSTRLSSSACLHLEGNLADLPRFYATCSGRAPPSAI